MASKDQKIASVVAELDGLLDQLRLNVDALNAILEPPRDTPDAGKELAPQ